jgi:hypothetical protein
MEKRYIKETYSVFSTNFWEVVGETNKYYVIGMSIVGKKQVGESWHPIIEDHKHSTTRRLKKDCMSFQRGILSLLSIAN